MFLLIAFLGGMISLLSPCTLPVIPLLFAGFQGQRRHILALLAGMIVMFTLVAMVVTVASEWIAEATIVGRWIALVILAAAALALIFPSFASVLRVRPSARETSSTPEAGKRAVWHRLFWPGWRLGCSGLPAPGPYWAPFSALISPATRPLRRARCWRPMAADAR